MMTKRVCTLWAFAGMVCAMLWSVACGSVTSMQGGHADRAYVVVQGQCPNKACQVMVQIDDEAAVALKIAKKPHRVKEGERLPITPGKHHVRITLPDGTLLHEQDIFLSTTTTKVISLD